MTIDGSKRDGILGLCGIDPGAMFVTIPAKTPLKEIIGNFAAPPSLRVRGAIVDGSFDSSVVQELIRFLIQRGVVLPSETLAIFSAALELKVRVAIPQGLAKEISRRAKKDSMGKPFLFIGQLKKPLRIPPFWKKVIPKETVAILEDPKKFINEIEKDFLENSGIKELDQDIEGYKELLYNGMTRASGALQKILPEKLYPKVIDSLKKDYDEVLGESLKGSVYQKIMDESIEKVLKKSFESGFSAIYDQLVTSANGLINEMSTLAPPFLQGSLEAVGLARMSNNEFWIEVNHENDSFYSVTIHGDDSSGRLDGMKLPLTYLHVPKERIGVYFWTAILRFSFLAEKEEAVEFTVKDVVLTLDDLLEVKGKTVRPPMNCRGPFEMLQSYLGKKVEPQFVADLFEKKRLREASSALLEPTQKELTLLPPFIQKLIEDMGPNATDINYIKKIVSAILGKDAEEALNGLLEEIPKQVPKKGKVKENFHKSLFAEIKTMRFSLLHLARLASRISTFMAEWVSWRVTLDCLVSIITFAFPGINLVLSVPVRYLCSLLLMYGVPVLVRYLPPTWITPVARVFSFYYKTLKMLEREITVLLLKYGSRMILSKQFVDDLREKLLALQSEFTRSGELDFRVVRKDPPLEEGVVITLQVTDDKAFIQVTERVSEDVVSHYSEVTQITEKNLSSKIQLWKNTAAALLTQREKQHYLNQQLRNLPIPGEDGSSIWEKIENPDAILEEFHYLITLFADHGLLYEEKIELAISLYTIYVAIDRVAKHPKTTCRIPEAYLANGRTFLLWQNSLGIRALRPRSRAKLRAISVYFKGLPDKIYKKDDHFDPALFEFTKELYNTHIPEVDKEYLVSAELPTRAALRIEEIDIKHEKLIALFCECPELKPYYYLREIHIAAVDALVKFTTNALGISPAEFVWIKEPVFCDLQARLRRATRGIFTDHHIFFRHFYSSYKKANFPNRIPGYKKHSLTQSKLAVLGPYTLYEVKRETCLLINMVELVPSDQIVRAISLFRQNPASLRNKECASHFQGFILRPSLIKAAFEERNLILRDMGFAFLELFNEVANEESLALFVAHVAGDFITLAKDLDPDIGAHTPNFKSIVQDRYTSFESKLVIAGMYVDLLPETATEVEKTEVLDFVKMLDPLISRRSVDGFVHLFKNSFIRANELIFTWKGYVLGKRLGSGHVKRSIVQEEIPRQIEAHASSVWILNPEKDKHYLHLLSWFQSFDDMIITCDGNFVKTIEFKSMKLVFDVREESGKYSAYPRDPNLSSYALSPIQKDVRLKSFVNYLVLVSETTLERRICIPVPDAEVIFSKHFMHEQKEFLSPFLEKVFTSNFHDSKYYSYSFSEKGELTSDEPAALAFLTLHYITRKSQKEALLAFNRLSLIGHRKAFCKDTQNFINMILILEFFFKSPSPIFLQLVALSHKNSLLQSKTTKSEEDQIVAVALFAMIQVVYSSYITEKKKFLSEFEELFILKYITANSPIPEKLKAFKFSLRDLSMLPVCAFRYQFLRRKYGDDPNSWRYRAERALIHKLTNIGSNPPEISFLQSVLPSFLRGSSSRGSYLPKLLDALDHPCVKNPWEEETKLSFAEHPVDKTPPLNLRALTPSAMHDNFLTYYTILYNKEDGYEKLAKNLLHSRGKFSNKSIGKLLFILQTLAKSIHPKRSFPQPRHLSKPHIQKSLVNMCMGKSLISSITPHHGVSILKSLAKKAAMSKISYYLYPALKAIKMGHRVYKGVQLIRAAQLPAIPRGRPRELPIDDCISEKAFAELSLREREIDELLTLEGGERVVTCANRPFQFVYPLIGDDAIAREFEKLNESIALFTELPKFAGVTHKFIGDRKVILEALAMEEAELESLSGIPFREMLLNYVMGTKTKFDQKITLHLVSLSRWKAYFKRSSLKRAYKFDEISEKHLRVFLVFEVKAETLIWQRQYGPLINLLNSKQLRSVCEAIMGIGKTATLMPIKDCLDAGPESLAINLRPSAIAVSATEKSAEVSFDLFHQVTSVIPLTRSGWSAERLDALNMHIDEMVDKRGIWDATKEQFQTLQLRFIEETLDVLGAFQKEDKSSWLARLELFQKILLKIRKLAKVNIDEAHIEFDRKTELNYPLGVAKPLGQSHAEVLEEVMLSLLTILPLSSKAPRRVLEDEYKKNILPKLATSLAKGDRALERYFLNQAPIAFSNERLDLIKGALNSLVPSILEEIVHVNYATLKEGSIEFAKPSDGNENPEVESTYKIQFAAFLKTAFLLLTDRLNKVQLEKMILTLKQKARAEWKGYGVATDDMLNHTEAGLYFTLHSKGYKLFPYNCLQQDVIFQNLNQVDLVVLDYCRIHIRQQIRYFNFSISSNAHNVASMFKSFSGYTASPYNSGTYPEGAVVIKDPGTQGETVSLLVERNSRCHTLTSDAPRDALVEICERFFSKESLFRAIIDRGAIFNGLSNETVARALLTQLEKTELKAVVFYNGKKELMIWEKGRKDPIPFKESKMAPEDRLTYFDQSHTFAADVLQGIEAKALVTVGESTIAEELFQAIWRMRGLKTKGQDVEFITTRYTKALISGEEDVTIEKIVTYCLVNQGKESLEDNFASDLAAMHNVIQRAVLDKALSAKSVKTMIGIIRDFKALFLSENTGDPRDFFGGMDAHTTPEEVFRETRRKLVSVINTNPLFEIKEVDQIRLRLEGIGHNFYPASVLKREKIDTHARQQISEEQVTCELEVEKEKMELKQELKDKVYQEKEEREAAIHKKWPSRVIYTDRPELVVSNTPHTLFSLSNVLKGHPNHEIRPIAAELDRRILLTNNLMPTPKTAFDEFQIPVLEAFAVFDEDHQLDKFILLSAEEAREHREMLQKERGSSSLPSEIKALVDINTKLIASEGKISVNKEMLHSPELELIFLQVKFLFGHTYYSLKEEELLTAYLFRLDLPALKTFTSFPEKAESLCESTLQSIIYKIRSEKEPHTLFLRV